MPTVLMSSTVAYLWSRCLWLCTVGTDVSARRNQATDDCSASAVVQTPEQVRAYPKAAARKLPATGSKRTRKRKTAILTDTPVTKQLEIQSEGRKCGVARRQKMTSQRKLKKPKLSDPDDRCSNSCGSVVGGFHTDKRIKEHWYKCTKCSRWAHESRV